jgi:indolepyruvate ferredoxin oxidoreductase
MLKGADDTIAPKTLDEMSLDDIIAHRSAMLTDYQNKQLAARYRALVDRVRHAAMKGGYDDELPRAVAINYAKLLAYKDEYEVARLYTDGSFARQVASQFEGDYKISINLAPPMLPGTDATGRPRKRAFGAWILPAFRVLASLRGLRGTPLDPFGRTNERRMERDLITGYEKDVDTVLGLLSPLTVDTAVALLSLPDQIRGYGFIKDASIAAARVRYAELAKDLSSPPAAPRQIAAE